MSKNFGLIVKASYVTKADDHKLMEAIVYYEAAAFKANKVNCDAFDRKVVNRVFKRSGEDRSTCSRAVAECNSGEYKRLYIVSNSKDEPDYFRENAYPKDDRYAHKSIPERFADEYHATDPRNVHVPMVDKNVDSLLYWFCAKIKRGFDIVHIDLNQEVVRAYSVSDEFYAPIIHDDALDVHEANWATVLAYSGLDRLGIKWLMENMTEDELYEFANGGMTPGHTPDKQIVKCPECGEPTWASPASVGYKSYDGTYKCRVLDASQMKCSHCGADLSVLF